MTDRAWQAIFEVYNIYKHDFNKEPFRITANEIKEATTKFTRTGEREPRILAKHDSREYRPRIFQELGLFILPIKNGEYAILRGEGYVDIPPINDVPAIYISQLDFVLKTAQVGDSEMQHLDFAYATSLIRSIMDDDSLVLTIRGRKYTPAFSFFVGEHKLNVSSVQTEVDAGYEGRNQVLLIEVKNRETQNTHIRQLFYPYRQWGIFAEKPVRTIFFEQRNQEYHIWHFDFSNQEDYNSIHLLKSERYVIKD